MSGVELRPRVLAAPDSFKGTFSSIEVAEAMSQGATDAGWEVRRAPMADGGEGTAVLLAQGRSGNWVRVDDATGADGEPVDARFFLCDSGDAFLDAAAVVGLPKRINRTASGVLLGSTYGLGTMLSEASRVATGRLFLGTGGTSTMDGGAGLLAALGPRIDDVASRTVALVDTDASLSECARMFGPQKGADKAAVDLLAARLCIWSETLPRNPWLVPGTGAGGGLSAALWGWGATLRSGAEYILEQKDASGLFDDVQLVVTGEGRFDEQSLRGKLLTHVLRRAQARSLPVAVICGRNDLQAGVHTGIFDVKVATTLGAIRYTTRELCRGFADRPQRQD